MVGCIKNDRSFLEKRLIGCKWTDQSFLKNRLFIFGKTIIRFFWGKWEKVVFLVEGNG
jgi:hypothetical protein